MRYSPLTQINRSNVNQLVRKWTYHTGEQISAGEGRHRLVPFECTPLVVDGILYLSTPFNRVIALDAETGREIWQFDPEPDHAAKDRRALKGQHRGVAFWSGRNKSGKTIQRVVFGTYDGRLISLDATTGRPDRNFGLNGIIDLRLGAADRYPQAHYAVTSPPAVYQDLIITGSAVPEAPANGPSGVVRAFNVRTGNVVWSFETVPPPGEFGNDTWEANSWKDRTGVNAWSIISVDVERGIVYLPLGSPAYDFYGGDRKGNNLFGNSLVALDANTGKRIWHYQLVHHDVWDYDLPAQPSLVTFTQAGKKIQAVVQVTKMGLVFVFDRSNGTPIFGIEERPVPASEVFGESTSPSQPFPIKPAPLSRQNFDSTSLTTVTPESQQYCSDLMKSLSSRGPYTPFGETMTLIFPGTLGGATWSGVSFDPTTSLLYVNTNEVGAIGTLTQRSETGSDRSFRRTSPWGEYARFWDSDHYPCQQPPWGLLQAIDLKTGELAWKVPLGIVDRLAEKGLAPTGTPSLGGTIVTAGGLVFIGGTNDSRFRAFDSKTGKELWLDRLEASGHATPITYLGKRTRRQFVVIAAGGGGSFSDSTADVLAAYGLPDGTKASESR